MMTCCIKNCVKICVKKFVNAITRLSKKYESKLLLKIQNEFSETQQHLFVASFYCYLNYNSKTEFIINLDDIWKWVGFSRKDPAKRILEKHFVVDIDYKILLHQVVEQVHGGHNAETIMLTINTFKKFCMKAGTKKADEIHDYYIKLEELLHETMNEESDELKLQLTTKDLVIQKLENKIEKSQKRKQYDNRNYIYMLTSEVHASEKIYIIGKAVNLTDRLSTYNKTLEHDVAYYKSCKSREHMRIIETMILLKLDKYRQRANRDRFILPEDKDISLFTNIIDLAIKWFDDIDDFSRIYDEYDLTLSNEELQEKFVNGIKDAEEQQQTKIKEDGKIYYEKNKENISQYHKNYFEDNKEEIAEKSKKYHENNKEKIHIQSKKYREEHKEEISERGKKYYEENKEEIIDKVKIYRNENKEKIFETKKKYREEHKEEIAEKKKEYNDEHKEEISEKKKFYYDENKDTILQGRKEYYEENKEKLVQKSKNYYEENKDKLFKKEMCECGIEVCHSGMARHKKTKRHEENMVAK